MSVWFKLSGGVAQFLLCIAFLGAFARAKDESAPPEWTSLEGKLIDGVPLRTSYNNANKEMDFVFEQANGSVRNVPCSAFSDEVREAIGKMMDKRKRDQKVRETQQKSDMERQQRQLAEKEKADFNAKIFKLSDGSVVTVAEAYEYNTRMLNDQLPKFMFNFDADDYNRYNTALAAFTPIRNALQDGDRKAVLAALEGPASTQQVRRGISWLVNDTPARAAIIPCSDGRALRWSEAWPEAIEIWSEAVRENSRKR
ncbi:MAG: hypothetical protein WCK17_16500 [Verrucomicrobiota bacterium]